MTNETPNQTTVQTYETALNKYIAWTEATVSGIFKERIDTTLSYLPKTAKILELGTGLWRDADYMENQWYTVQRSDYPDSFIEYNRQQGKKITKLDALNLDTTRKIDALFANAVLSHFDTTQFTKIITDIHQILNDWWVLAFSIKRWS